ncbi:MAG: hypothetical protein V7642_5134 [Burkholderiales bacterium]|jgi:tripartite-type tricarboxylate transporter receptor subunit TctC
MLCLLRTILLCAATSLSAFTSPATAEAYPDKPIRLVVPAALGTPIDIVSRLVAKGLSAELKQPVIVDVRPGATGTVGAQEVLNQPADGYTLMVLHMPMSVAQSIYERIPFSLHRAFVPIGQTAWSYNVLVVHPSVPASTPAELAALLKSQPGKLSFSSGGPGTPAHVAGELFRQQIGASVLHVPYNQFSQAVVDLVTGRNQFMFAATPPMIQYIASERLRALAVTGPNRIPALKDVPTMAEAGFPDFVVRDWQGIVAKSGTPQEVVSKVNSALNAVAKSESFKSSLAGLGADPAPGTPAQFRDLIDGEVGRWAVVARKGNLKVD